MSKQKVMGALIFGITTIIPFSFVQYKNWSYLLTVKVTEGKLCGLPSMATFVVGLGYSTIATIIAFGIAFALRKRKLAAWLPDQSFLIFLAASPVWFVTLTLLANLAGSKAIYQ